MKKGREFLGIRCGHGHAVVMVLQEVEGAKLYAGIASLRSGSCAVKNRVDVFVRDKRQALSEPVSKKDRFEVQVSAAGMGHG